MLTQHQRQQIKRLAASQIDWHTIAQTLNLPYAIIADCLGDPHDRMHQMPQNNEDQQSTLF